MTTSSGSPGSMQLRSLTVQSLGALAVGILGGLVVYLSGLSDTAGLLAPLDVIIRIWTNAFRLIVLPLVFSQLYVTIATGGTSKQEARRLVILTPLLVVGLLVATMLFTFAVTPPLLALPFLRSASLPRPGASAAPIEAAPVAPSGDTAAWVDEFVPANLFAAASADRILALMLFAVLFALAARRLPAESRRALDGFFGACCGALFVMVDWLFRAAPLVVFALGFRAAAQAGLDVGGALLAFTAVESAVLLFALAALYPLAVVAGRVSLRPFARALWPAQITAATTRSSLATLPALLQGAQTWLGASGSFSTYVIPLAGATLKLSRAVSDPVTLLFLAQVLGIRLGFAQIVLFTVTILLLSPSSVGVPRVTSGTRSLPAYVALGIPPEYVVLLAATTAVADVFMTLLNTTGYMTANVLVGRLAAEERGEPALSPEGVAATDRLTV